MDSDKTYLRIRIQYWRLLHWGLIFLIGMSSKSALAVQYTDGLEAYTEQKFARAYRIAMELADRYEGEDARQAKSLVLAAVAALELGKESRAIKLYKMALKRDPEIELPKVIKSKRVISFFQDVKSGKTLQTGNKGSIVEVVSKSALDEDDGETYLPFGINQFREDKLSSGLLLGSVQAFGLFYAYQQYTSAKKTEDTLKKKTSEVIASGDYETSAFKNYRAKSEAASKKMRRDSQLALAAALAAYGTSVAEIIWNPPTRLKVVELQIDQTALSNLASWSERDVRSSSAWLLSFKMTLDP